MIWKQLNFTVKLIYQFFFYKIELCRIDKTKVYSLFDCNVSCEANEQGVYIHNLSE